MTDLQVNIGDCYESGNSRRVIKEFDPSSPKFAVIYSLYRKQEVWNPRLKEFRMEWWLIREGYCGLKTFVRWLKGAAKVTGPRGVIQIKQ